VGIVILVGFLIGCFAMLAVLERGNEAVLSWQIRRALRRFGSGGPLDPESRFVVRLGDDDVQCERPDHTIERVTWRGLNRVEIVSTSDGPLHPDTFWVLTDDGGGCAIPWGATGESVLLARLQQLPGFDHQAVVHAASESGEARRVCWDRGTPRRQARAIA